MKFEFSNLGNMYMRLLETCTSDFENMYCHISEVLAAVILLMLQYVTCEKKKVSKASML